jgi:beta-galactosidase
MIKKILFIALASLLLIQCGNQKFSKRQTISLNGIWEVEESLADEMPKTFSHQTPVPGIIDTASPSFDSAGLKCKKRNYYWYRSFFTLEKELSPVVLLKINKACFGTKLFINGKEVGYNPYCFTPSYFNIHDFVKAGEKNEIVVRLGAWRDNLPDSIPDGRDYEKTKYFSGIYDDVNIILSDFPYIENVQIAPDIDKKQIRVVAEINSDKDLSGFKLEYQIEEAKSGDKYISSEKDSINLSKGINKIDFIVPINDCHLWSPEDPFLYKLNLTTGKDSKSERFGMRSFRFDPTTGKAILNGKPYAMLGTNICIFRFFEDYTRGVLPWNEDWVRKLHMQFKNMNWNCIRYCIGFPPEKWYEIADETGLLIQDEYPLWRAGENVETTENLLAEEYTRWMRERWNHPCVVVWDGTNETFSEVSGKAIDKVRHLDLSGRPFDNGYSLPRKADDCIESHPYLFVNYCGFWNRKNMHSEKGYMKEFFDTIRIPNNYPYFPGADSSQYNKLKNPVIINEYDWLWINRDGSPTTLTDSVYYYLFGKNLTTEQRRIIHAENVAMLTEYWRCHRKAAAVMHFCGLGYSRTAKPRGQTCDDFIDIQNLVYEPYFFKIVKPKFALVCNMIDKWEENYKAGEKLSVPVYFINDLQEEWKSSSLLYIQQAGKNMNEVKKDISVQSFGQMIEKYDIQMPEKPGEYKLISEIYLNNDTIRSVRKFEIK